MRPGRISYGHVGDAKHVEADEPAWPTFFLPLLETVSTDDPGYVSLQTRSPYIRGIEPRVDGQPGGVEAAARREIAAVLVLVASAVVARRAASIDPIRALRMA